MNALKNLGHPTSRIDAVERVTGQAMYAGDIHLPGMLHARVLRSPYPHARIRSIDLSRTRTFLGVRAVITHENCRVVWSSGDTRNKRYLFNNPVRFWGDAVAALAADTPHIAEEALLLIGVEYEELPFVLDPEEALKPGAVEIQPGGNLCLSKIPICVRRCELHFLFVFFPDAHFSCDTRCYSVFDVAFARCA